MPHEPPSLGTYLAIILSSTSDNEVAMAVRQLRKLAKAAGIDGHDISKAIEQRARLLEAARALRDERDALASENGRLKRLSHANGADNGFAQQLWAPAGLPTTVDNRHAQWLLDLEAQARFYLTAKEKDFLGSCATRHRLTAAMKDWLMDITRRAAHRTGEAPPP